MDLSVLSLPLMLSFVDKQVENQSLFAKAGVFTKDDRITSALKSGQTSVVVPNFVEPDYRLEPNYSNTVYNDIAEPLEQAFTSVKARVAYMNHIFGSAALYNELTKVNPNELVAKRCNAYWTTNLDMRAIASIKGIYNSNVKNKVDGTVLATTTAFSVDSFIDATSGMPFKGAIFVHPKVNAQMLKEKLTVPFTDPTGAVAEGVNVYNGFVVVVEKPNTKTGKFDHTALADGRFISYLLGQGSVVADSVPNERDMRIETSESRANGGGYDTLHTRRNAIVHPQGYSFIAEDDQLTGGTKNEALSPSYDDLVNPDFWQYAGGGNIRFMITK